MIEKPDLPDEQITGCLLEGYGIHAAAFEFLPLGNESKTWVYRVRDRESASYFLKLKKGLLYEPALTVPRFLQQQGIDEVVAPLPSNLAAEPGSYGRETLPAKLFVPLSHTEDRYNLILYPFIEGRTGRELGLTDAQWMAFGRTLRRIHAARLPDHLAAQLQRETFVPKWAEMVVRLQQRIAHGGFEHPAEKELAAFWQPRSAEIERITARALELGRAFRDQSPRLVLCHTDIHTANLLVDADQRLHIVDWDQPLLAPIERDLMFVIGAAGGRVLVEDRDQQNFLAGYGVPAYEAGDIDPLGLAYYRYEWVVQEIGDYGERVFFMHELGDETKRASVEGFIQLFAPGDVVAGAYQTEPAIPGSSPTSPR